MATLSNERSMSLNLDSWLNGVTGMEGTNFDELLNVNETFFDAYVKELEGQAPVYQGAPATNGQQPAGMTPSSAALPAAPLSGPFSNTHMGALAFPPGLPGLPQAAVQMSGIVQQPASSLPQTLSQTVSGGIPSTFTSGVSATLPQTVSGGLPALLPPGMTQQNGSSSSLNQAMMLAPSVTTGVPDLDGTAPELHLEHGSNSAGGDSGGDYVEIEEIDSNGKKKKRRIRTPKQQVLNKLAQQRYRERRKAKYSELESTVEGLVDQLERLQAVEKTNQDLKEKNEQLNKQLQEQQEQLEFLKQQLQFNTEAAAAMAARNGSEAAAEQSVTDYDALRSKLGGLIETMREVLGRHNLDIRLEGARVKELPQEVVGELAAAVADSCTLCMKLLSSNAPGVTQAMSNDMQRFNRVVCPFARATWNKALSNLNLTKEQEDMLLELRDTHLKNLRVLLDERHRLNMQAMALMIPRSSHDPTVEGQVKCRQTVGQMCALKQDTALSDALDKLKDNLKTERRGFMEVNYHLMHKVLTPVQAAKLLVDAYPHNIDALALSNCLAVKKGLQPDISTEECSKDSQGMHVHGLGSGKALPVC